MRNDFNTFSFRASDGNTVKLEYRSSLPSTSDLAKEYAKAGYPDRYAIFTEKQTGISALGTPLANGESEKGIFISCILRPSIFASQAGCIRPLSALALSLALEEHTSKNIGIGWIGDIYCEGVKIGKTNVEGKPKDSQYEFLIINFAVRLDEKSFPPRLTDMVRQVFEESNFSVPMIMAKTILNKFFSIYKDLKSPTKHLNLYASKFALNNVRIKFIENGKKKTVKCVGINKEDISLIAETRDGRSISINSPSSIITPNKI